jgi:ABC-2 type transport system ATP-binding protein
MDLSDNYVIQTNGLSKSFNGIHALNGLNLRVSKHSIFGFLGRNGAGKSTTIKLLLGLAQPTAGSGTVFGLDICKRNPEIRRRVGYLAQDPRYYGRMTARETLRFTAQFFFGGPKQEIEARVEEMLELVGLEEKADRPIREFSSGERQRLGIAQAQINYPELLILDEPAASLDPIGRHQVLEIMERLCTETTIFYSTHILSDVQRISDAVELLGGIQGRRTKRPIAAHESALGDFHHDRSCPARPDDLGDRRERRGPRRVTAVQAARRARHSRDRVRAQEI